MSEWTSQAADTIEKTVVAVRDRTVEPATRAANYMVYGVFAACCVLTALLLMHDRALPGPHATPCRSGRRGCCWVESSSLGGMFCWTRRTGGPSV